jgi:hypothetical protein
MGAAPSTPSEEHAIEEISLHLKFNEPIFKPSPRLVVESRCKLGHGGSTVSNSGSRDYGKATVPEENRSAQ